MIATLEFSDGGIRFVLFCSFLLPAVLLAIKKSSYLIDYYIIVVCLNRLVRRLLDWAGGEYDPQPLSSLLPMVIASLMLAVVVSEQHHMAEQPRKALRLIGAALGYATLIGATNGVAMVYSLLEYVAPVALLFYAIAVRVHLRTLDRWIDNLTRAAVGVAAYGWYQWAFMPPWDANWIEWSEMWTSMGHPESFKTSVCSTLESRGPYAWFLVTASIPMLASPRWRRAVGWPGAMFVVVSILPSTVRSAWGMLAVGVASFVMIRGGQNWARIACTILLSVGVLFVVKSGLPESERLFSRLETVTELAADSSLQGRTLIAREGLRIVLNHPQGYGLGSSGLAGKISGQSGVIGDNGFLELLATFGLPGSALLISGSVILLRDVVRIHQALRMEHAALALSQVAAGVAAMAFANWLSGPYSGMALMPIGAVMARQYRLVSEHPIRSSQTRMVTWAT